MYLLYIHFPFQRFDFSCSVKAYSFVTPLHCLNSSECVFDRDCPSFFGKKLGKVAVPVTTPPKDLGENSLEHPFGNARHPASVCCWGAQKLNDYI